ncbi:dephospho-CoA kinase [Carboxydothermus pertinax]|uniref:Dephospho-CoA kinase n=1 Tax=Carboxydothermus pertinax TaxID=870242 RepID=A0A1L8CXB2_9THEO|nr:dephospho-CoA kinase [Carboxydothermus pertinax]GAV23562.1 dephospho-CoA kinase [Carboxydothermus pertinax]
MPVIGLTGGIASGKSTVSKLLEEHGFIIIDADQIAREILNPGKPAYQKVIANFGREILKEDGQIDRIKLGKIVFSDPEKLALLNRLTHPEVGKEIRSQLNQLKEAGIDRIVLDIPLLFEAQMQDLVDIIWVVYVPEEEQIKRLMTRNGFTREEAIKRIRSQMPLDEKARLADVVIDNSGSLEKTREQIIAILQEWK